MANDIYSYLTNLDNTEEAVVRSDNSTDTTYNGPTTREEAIQVLISQGEDPKKIQESDITMLLIESRKNATKIVSDTTVDDALDGISEGYKTLSATLEYNLDAPHTNDTRHISQINRFRLNQFNDKILGKKAFIFMTRPNLNLFKTDINDMHQCSLEFDSNGRLQLNPDLERLPMYNYIWGLGKNEFHKDDSQENPNTGLSIFESLNIECDKHKSPWLSVISNTATSYTVNSRDLDTATAGATFHGNKIMYGEPTFTHKTAGTVTLSFTDKRDLSLYYTLKIWVDYIHQVVLGTASPYRKYICKAMLDYAVSLYYIVTDETMENIVYWEKLTGVFPMNIPDEIFSSNEEAFKGIESTSLDYNIQFTYSMRSVQHEHHLLEINALYDIIKNETTSVKVDDAGIHVLNNTESTYDTSKGAKNILSTTFANNAFDYYNGKSSTTTAADGTKFESYLNSMRNYYGMAERQIPIVENKRVWSSRDRRYYDSSTVTGYNTEPAAWRYYSIIKNTDNDKARFLANWLPDVQTHGVPFVNGPYITLGSSYSTEGSESSENIITEANEQSKYNKGQYKLRWI